MQSIKLTHFNLLYIIKIDSLVTSIRETEKIEIILIRGKSQITKTSLTYFSESDKEMEGEGVRELEEKMDICSNAKEQQ